MRQKDNKRSNAACFCLLPLQIRQSDPLSNLSDSHEQNDELTMQRRQEGAGIGVVVRRRGEGESGEYDVYGDREGD